MSREHLREAPADSDYRQADREDRVAAQRSPVATDTDAQDPIGATIRLGDATLAKADALLGAPKSKP